MVKIIIESAKQYYQCEECGFRYAEKELAEKCESWCGEHAGCDIEITVLPAWGIFIGNVVKKYVK